MPASKLLNLVKRAWDSPGQMTAASVVARAFGIAAPLPFLYATLPVEAVAFWLSVTTFQALVGAFSGIVPTVAMQMISYARAGSASVGGSMTDHARTRSDAPNWALIACINRVTLRMFFVIALAWILFSTTVGTFVVWRPMMASGAVTDAAIAWGIFVLGSAIRFLGQPYATFGLGLGAVAEVRRREALGWLIGGVGAVAVLVTVPDLTFAMIAIQAPVLLNYLQFRRLARRLGWVATDTRSVHTVFSELWTRSWRGGVAAFASVLTIYGNGFVYAQIGSSESTAGYLLGLNVLGIIGQVAVSPLMAAGPALAARYAQGRQSEMNALAHHAISRSKQTFVALAVVVPIAVAACNFILPVPVEFPGGALWLAMCLSAILLRHSADHLLYYTTTNDIRGHIINPVLLAVSLGPFLVLPASNVMWLIAMQGFALTAFHFPYSRNLTWRRFGYDLRREWSDFVLPVVAMMVLLGGWALLPLGG